MTAAEWVWSEMYECVTACIAGTNFGASDAKILVGGSLGLNTQHIAPTPHNKITVRRRRLLLPLLLPLLLSLRLFAAVCC